MKQKEANQALETTPGLRPDVSHLQRRAKNSMRRIVILLAISLLAGCATTPKKIEETVPALSDRPVDAWLMPLEGFPPDFARELEKKFSTELGLNVRATVHAGRTQKMFGASRQMISERVRDELQVPLHRLFDLTPKTIFIVLTRDDLNGEYGGTRFVFATHFPAERLSIISMARLSDAFFGKPDSSEMTKLRLYKMVKKTIGLQYYGYARATDLKSVMYSPVMSLDDLDAIGTNF